MLTTMVIQIAMTINDDGNHDDNDDDDDVDENNGDTIDNGNGKSDADDHDNMVLICGIDIW